MDTTGRLNLWTFAACHQGALTRLPLAARTALRPSFKGLGVPWRKGLCSA